MAKIPLILDRERSAMQPVWDKDFLAKARADICQKDTTMKRVLDSVWPMAPQFGLLDFATMASIITNQQLSKKAADTIFARVRAFAGGDITPATMIRASVEGLRQCGLSRGKITYIKALAQKCLRDENYLQDFLALGDAAAFARIRKNKGFGDWSAYIFLLFCLRRADIFPRGDATLHSAISDMYGVARKQGEEIEKIARVWAPYRSVASLALWQWADQGRAARRPVPGRI